MSNQLFLKKICILFIAVSFIGCNDDDESRRTSEGWMRINNRDLNIESSGILNNAYAIMSSGNNTISIVFSDGNISLVNGEIQYGNDVTNIVELELDAIESIESTTYIIPTIDTFSDFNFSLPHINYYTIYADISTENGSITPNTGAAYSSISSSAAPSFGKIEITEDNSFFEIDFQLDYATLPQYKEVVGYFSGTINILQ